MIRWLLRVTSVVLVLVVLAAGWLFMRRDQVEALPPALRQITSQR